MKLNYITMILIIGMLGGDSCYESYKAYMFNDKDEDFSDVLVHRYEDPENPIIILKEVTDNNMIMDEKEFSFKEAKLLNNEIPIQMRVIFTTSLSYLLQKRSILIGLILTKSFVQRF
jgi:hypothetical protein